MRKVTDIKLLQLYRNIWNDSTSCKYMIISKKNYSYEIEMLETI